MPTIRTVVSVASSTATHIRPTLFASRAGIVHDGPPTLAADAAALPPEGTHPVFGPSALVWSPHACGFAAALPPGGAGFAPWAGPAGLMAAPHGTGRARGYPLNRSAHEY